MKTESDTIKKVLVLLNDVDPLLNRVTKNKLEKDMGWDCMVAVSYDQAMSIFVEQNPDAVITEILILDHKNRNGVDLIEDIRVRESATVKKVPIIIFSEMDEEGSFKKALKSGATACYSKNNISLNLLISELQKFVD
ncbi:response regulator [Candidatus Saccharibacteria bacterium]|nr:response regulator [Candidatus Saccharibacteria bacterium]